MTAFSPRRSSVLVLLALLAAGLPFLGRMHHAEAVPNPVATDAATYAAYGRVFPDPQGCLSADADGNDVNDVVAPNASPWAKGNVCVAQFLTYEEFIEGSKFLEKLYPRFLNVVRLDQAYDNPNYRSAGLPRVAATEDGQLKLLGRDRRPLYMLKVTDRNSPIPENMRYHFVYSGSIHGIERAGAEGQIRAAEDLVTWAANLPNKKIVETPTKGHVPTAGETLRRSVIYFIFPNPDGWARGQLAPTEANEGSPNISYSPGVYYQRYNGNGMDLNRDVPTLGYTYRPYTPGSNPETQANVEVLTGIRKKISTHGPVGRRFTGGIDLHGQLNANAFSFTLAGAGQRDFGKNAGTVDQGLRTWADQTARLSWSPYIGSLFETADQWGTTIDTIGYQITGAIGDWFESEKVGLGAVGIDNEMSLSHIAPNIVYDPTLEQMHIDGNKGLIYSQIASLLNRTPRQYRYTPTGKIGYVFNPHRLVVKGKRRTPNPSLAAQDDVDVLVPCQSGVQAPMLSCDEPGVTFVPATTSVEFDVKGPKDGFWNGGITAQMTNVNAAGISPGSIGQIALERFDTDHPGTAGEAAGEWETVQTSFVQAGNPDLYLQAGQEVTANDPIPGRWRVRFTSPGSLPARLKIDFNPVTAEASPGQAPIDASSMDFFGELNNYIKRKQDKLVPISIDQIAQSPASLSKFDSIVVTNNVGNDTYLKGTLHLSSSKVQRYFAGLKSFTRGGGNLVLTDAGLKVLPKLGVVKPSAVVRGTELAGRYEFGKECNRTPLTKKVCLSGTAGGTSRQAVEPTPLGYSPDLDLDNAPSRVMPVWFVKAEPWNNACPKGCGEGDVLDGIGLGAMPVGKGEVRIAGTLLPDPIYAPGGPADMRFGLADYSLTFSGWQIFLNLVNYRR